MKLFSKLLIVSILFLSSCAKIYQAPAFATERSKHKTMAILPFKISFSPRSFAKGTELNVITAAEEKHTIFMQEQIYTYFLSNMGSGSYSIEIQDISRTNAILKKANIGSQDIASKTREELATLLGVDVVLSGNANMTKPMSDLGAVFVHIVGGVAVTNRVSTSISIHDKQDKLMWHYTHTCSGDIRSSTEKLSNKLMRKVVRKFPYQS